MKKNLLVILVSAFAMQVSGQTVLFSQNFDGPPLTNPDVPANYVNSVPANANDNQFTGLAVSSGGAVEINNQKLRFTRVGTSGNWTFNRGGKNFSTVPAFLKFSVDISVVASPVETMASASFNIGSTYPSGTASPSATASHSRITLYLSDDGKFSLVPVGNTTAPALKFTSARMSWFVNNSGETATYTGPDGTLHSVDNDRSDTWLDNTLLPDLTNFTGQGTDPANMDLKQFKFTFTSGGQGTMVDFDNIEVTVPAYTLPVKLLSFSGRAAGTANQLTWVTTSEQNSAHFNVLRSVDGNVFSSIGKINAAGNSVKEAMYSFTDEKPLSGTNYYRLSQVDKDGKATASATIAVKRQGKQPSLSIVSFNKYQIVLSAYSPAQQTVHVKITDVAGRLINTRKVVLQQGSNVLNIQVENQLANVNVGSIIYSNGEVYSTRFVSK
jgi:hypothetical protein